jgi:flagellar capping protein FliD
MASVSSLGISGLLTAELLDNLVAAEREASQIRINSDKVLAEARLSAVGTIKSKASAFQSAAAALANSDNITATKVTSSNEGILTASADDSANLGSYSVEVQNIAKSHSLASKAFSSPTDAVAILGAGETQSLVFSFGTTLYSGSTYTGFTADNDKPGGTITISESNNSLSGIRDSINAAGIGVSASIVNDGSGYRLQVVSATGVNNSMEMTAQDSSGNTLSTGLSQLAYNLNQNDANNHMTENQKGEDALLSVNGLTITRESNSVTEVISGVTLDLKSANVGTNVVLSIAPDSAGITEKAKSFVDAYNDFKTTLDEYTAYDATQGSVGLLTSDASIRSLVNQVNQLLSSPITQLSGSKDQSLADLGFYTDKDDDYLMKLNTTELSKALSRNRSDVVGIFSTSGTASDINIQFMNESVDTQAGDYDVEIVQLATQAEYQGGSLSILDFASPVVIDDSNNDFTINLNNSSATLTLTKGSYATGEALANEIQQAINSAPNYVAKGYSASVLYNSTDERFEIRSNLYGSSSTVSFSAVDTNTANTLGFNTVGAGAFEGSALSTLHTSYFVGAGASTVPTIKQFDADEGIDFSTNTAGFSLSVDGAPAVAVTVNQNAASSDLNGDSIFGDRKDVLQAIQNGIDATSLNGSVVASFNSNGQLVFTTATAGASKSIELTAADTNAVNFLGLDASKGVQTNGRDTGVTLASDATFKVDVNGTVSANTVTLAAGNFADGDALAAALQTAINTSLSGDANLSSLIFGASTDTGTRDISTNIDFTTANSGFVLNVNGTSQTVLVNTDSGNNITDVQAALDTAFGAGVVAASDDGGKLKLTTVATGHQQYIQVVSDGRGSQTSAGSIGLTGIDFSAQNTSFRLTVDGVDLDVTVNTDATQGSNDANSTLTAIQSAINTALESSGQFSAGDVVAKLDGSNQLYFESVTKNGIKTAATFGSSSSVQLSNTAGNANTLLGLSDQTVTNGYDAFGIGNDIKFGSDVTAEVSYDSDNTTNRGQLTIALGGNGNSLSFTEVSASAISTLGVHEPDGSETQVDTGKDVAGFINGRTAVGKGQFLSAVTGVTEATNGYYLGNTAPDFSVPVVIDGSNNTFKMSLNGTESTITLSAGTYASGAALAAELQGVINNRPEYSALGYSVKVEYTTDTSSVAFQKFSIISSVKGSESTVEITESSAGVIAAMGLIEGKANGVDGTDASGEANPAGGLRIKVSGGDLGSRGQVTYISGIADQLSDLLSGFLNIQDGLFSTRERTLNARLDDIQSAQERLDARMLARESLLRAQFIAGEKILAQIQISQDFLTRQFDAFSSANKQ